MSLRIRLVLLALVMGVALGLRLWWIDRLPPGFHFDEAFEGLEAWRILRDASYRPLFLAGNFGVLPFNVYANALTFAVFEWLGGGAGPTAMRVTAALFGVAGVLAVYGLAGELRVLRPSARPLSPLFPIFAAATLALMRWHLHFSRMGIEPILTPMLWAGAIWLLLRGWRTGSIWSAIGCGVLLAASMYAYQGAWVIPLLAMATGVILLLAALLARQQKLGEIGGDWGQPAAHPPISSNPLQSPQFFMLVIAALVATLLVAPLGWYFWQHPEQFLLRPAQIVVGGAGEAAASASLGEMVWATAKMFGPFGAPGDQDPRRNLPGAPALNFWLALPFYLGWVIALFRLRWPAYLILLVSLIGLLLPGVFTEYAPHFHRVVGASAPVALICAVGLDWLWGMGDRLRVGARARLMTLRWMSVLLLLLGGVVTVRDYFVRWAALPDLFYAFDVGLWTVGQRIAAMPPTTPVYLTPREATHPTIAFALAKVAGGAPQLVSFDGRHIFPLTAGSNPQPEVYAVIEHEDFRTRLLLPELFPLAGVADEIVDKQGQVYARFYTRPGSAPPQRQPQRRTEIDVGDGIRLVGYDVQPATLQPGEILYLQLYWQVDAAPSADWTVFTHVVSTAADGGRTVVAGQDNRPGAGSLPTNRWQAGWQILDEYQLPLAAELAVGVYEIEIGLYQPDGAHLPAGQPSLVLGEVKIE
jgi:hypothetical protein